ncbi:MAG: metallophosphoesterase [Sphingobacteriales bacterium]|nr:metallophosphoesterase [Sphingobacteriales bacterium]
MNILHFSDTHLGYHYYDKITEEGVNAREQDFYDAFSFIIDRIVEQRPDLVLHSGDFFIVLRRATAPSLLLWNN